MTEHIKSAFRDTLRNVKHFLDRINTPPCEPVFLSERFIIEYLSSGKIFCVKFSSSQVSVHKTMSAGTKFTFDSNDNRRLSERRL